MAKKTRKNRDKKHPNYTPMTLKRQGQVTVNLMEKAMRTAMPLLSKEELRRRGQKASKRGVSGAYEIAFTKRYHSMTEEDIDRREAFTVHVISTFLNLPKTFIRIRPIKQEATKLTASSRFERYTVTYAEQTIGKVSIQTQRVFNDTYLIIVYRSRIQGRSKELMDQKERQRIRNTSEWMTKKREIMNRRHQ